MQVLLNDVPVDMVLDTGKSLSVISQATFNRLKQHDATLTLHPSATRLLTYTGEPIPVMVSARIQRWTLTLAAYQYNIRYKSGKFLNNVDALSRLPHPIGQCAAMALNC